VVKDLVIGWKVERIHHTLSKVEYKYLMLWMDVEGIPCHSCHQNLLSCSTIKVKNTSANPISTRYGGSSGMVLDLFLRGTEQRNRESQANPDFERRKHLIDQT